jgi:hypothetical protein
VANVLTVVGHVKLGEVANYPSTLTSRTKKESVAKIILSIYPKVAAVVATLMQGENFEVVVSFF